MWHRTNPIHIERESGIVGPDEGAPMTVSVIEVESDCFSGIYDADGNPLCKRKNPIGFIWGE